MLKLAYKVGSRGGAIVRTSARNAGDPWFESRSWYDRFLYVNIHLFITTRSVVFMVRISQKSRNVLFPVLFYSVLATLMKKKSFVKDLFPVPANLHILIYWSVYLFYLPKPIKSIVHEVF